MIRNSSLETLKSQIDIVDIVEDFVELKKAGANFKACCPFHGEETASFVVSPTKQICHCFGCGVTYDAIGFVQEIKKLDFVEAVESIANTMNFKLEYDKESNKKNYSKVMEHINSFYINQLNQETNEYLLKRGITKESIEGFEIGLAPSSSLQIQSITKEMFSLPDAVECGILATDENGNTYARLTNRITFPIRNHAGKLIGFGGRILDGDRAKYLNSPQTPLFDKSRNLYGYNLAKEHIYKKGTFTVVEGYLDVVMFHQAGIKTVVATMGTALTEMHCNTIAKAQARALLCFDGDKAGITAAFKASKLLSSHGLFGGVVLFPEGKDPADMIKEGKRDELFALMKKPTPLIDFALKIIAESYNLTKPDEKENALKEIELFLKTLSPIVADEYKNYVAQLLQININHIHTPKETTHYEKNNHQNFINLSEMNIIKTANESAGMLDIVLDMIDSSMFTYHAKEFEMLLHKDIQLQGLLLREDIKIYSADELIQQVSIMQYKDYVKKLKQLANSNESYERVAFEMKKIKGLMFESKRGMKR